MTSKLLIPLPPTLYPIHTRENILTPHKDPYKYFDTPDHEDCFKKIYFATYWGTKTGKIEFIFMNINAFDCILVFLKPFLCLFSI